MNGSQWSDLPLVLTSEQAAAILQIKRRTVANMLDRGDLRGIKIGKEWRVSRAELLRFVDGDVAGKAPEKAAATTESGPVVIDKGGVLVVQTEPLADLTDFMQREHNQRVADLIAQAGL